MSCKRKNLIVLGVQIICSCVCWWWLVWWLIAVLWNGMLHLSFTLKLSYKHLSAVWCASYLWTVELHDSDDVVACYYLYPFWWMLEEWLVTGICLADWCLWYANKYELDEEIVLFESILTEELFFNSFSHSTQFYTTAISNDYILGMYLRNFAF